MTWRREIGDTLDASMEMPEQYGSRSYWRYQHVSALIGAVVLPALLVAELFDTGSSLRAVATVAAMIVGILAAIFFIRRDIRVQKRIDETGSPIADREPY